MYTLSFPIHLLRFCRWRLRMFWVTPEYSRIRGHNGFTKICCLSGSCLSENAFLGQPKKDATPLL